MALKQLSAVFLVFLICSLTFTNATACGSCTPAAPAPISEPKPDPNPTPCPTTPAGASCPKDALKLAVCANVLNLINVKVGDPVTKPCCTLIKGLADLEAAACLCTAIKANVLGKNLVVPVALNVLLSACQKTLPPGFKC